MMINDQENRPSRDSAVSPELALETCAESPGSGTESLPKPDVVAIKAQIDEEIRRELASVHWPDAKKIRDEVTKELEQASASVEWASAEKIRFDVAEALQRAFQQTDETFKNQLPKPRRSSAEFVQAIREGRDNLHEFAGHIIEEDVDLRGVTYPHRLVLHDVTFEGQVDLFDAAFSRSLDLAGCVFARGLHLALTKIDGQLVLSQCVLMARDLSEPTSDVFDCSYLRALTIQADQIQVRAAGGWKLKEVQIQGSVGLQAARIAGGLDLENTFFKGSLNLGTKDSVFTQIMGAACLEGTRIGGAVNLSSRFVDLEGVRERPGG